jgi:epoxyqueuosine reductase QueG
MTTNELSETIRTIAQDAGAELVGFTPVDKLEAEAPTGHKPSNLLPNARSIIVLAGGNKLNEDRHYVREIGSLSTMTHIELKNSVKLERRRTRTCIQAVYDLLIKQGYQAAVETHGWYDTLSFKQAALHAGLGVVGRGTFVIHPEYGTINVLACIVTNARLTYDRPLDMDLCKDCVICIQACKYGTYRKRGDIFEWNGGRCRFYNTIHMGNGTITTYGPCNGDCINFCPIGR